MRATKISQTVASIALTLAFLLPRSAEAAKTFYMDESTDYTGNGCENNDLNTVTESLANTMWSFGWAGDRWVNTDAWPQDFVESCSGTYGSAGDDDVTSDTKSLAVFAGHGNIGLLAYGHKHASRCNVDFSANMRLGSMGGDTAAVGMWLICDALEESSLPSEANSQWLRQQLGWTNLIGIGDDEPEDFFLDTWTMTVTPFLPGKANSDAWLSRMDGGGRHPMVVSYGSTESGCWNVHDGARLGDNVFTTERPSSPACQQGLPAFYYCYETI